MTTIKDAEVIAAELAMAKPLILFYEQRVASLVDALQELLDAGKASGRGSVSRLVKARLAATAALPEKESK